MNPTGTTSEANGNNTAMLLMILTLPNTPEEKTAEHFRTHLRPSANALNQAVLEHILHGQHEMEKIASDLTLHVEAFRKTGMDPEKTWFERRYKNKNLFWNEALRESHRIEFEIANGFIHMELSDEQTERLCQLGRKLPEQRKRLEL